MITYGRFDLPVAVDEDTEAGVHLRHVGASLRSGHARVVWFLSLVAGESLA